MNRLFYLSISSSAAVLNNLKEDEMLKIDVEVDNGGDDEGEDSSINEDDLGGDDDGDDEDSEEEEDDSIEDGGLKESSKRKRSGKSGVSYLHKPFCKCIFVYYFINLSVDSCVDLTLDSELQRLHTIKDQTGRLALCMREASANLLSYQSWSKHPPRPQGTPLPD